MGKTHSKPLGARHGRGTAWARHDMCESALRGHAVAKMVEALRYKPEGRGFDFQT